MSNVNSCVEMLSANPHYIFELLPLFKTDTLDLVNQDIFPISETTSCKKNYLNVKYLHVDNPFLENEIKGFVQHLAVDLHYSSATLKQYITQSLHTITKFMNLNHSECNSITDNNFEDLYSEYLEFLADQNIQSVSYSIHRVDRDMNAVDYPSKTHYVSGFVNFYKYIFSIKYPDEQNEYEKDIWDVRKLGIPYNTAISRQRYTINFTCIQQPWFRRIVKEYVYYRIQNRTIASVIEDLKALRLFSEFIQEQNIEGMNSIDRDLIERYFMFLSTKGFVTTTYNHRVSALRTFFCIGNMLDIDGMPTKPLILYSDFRKTIHKLPKYFSDNELKQMNDHIADLPIQIGRMFFVLENCGMRVSDICSTPILINDKPSLEKNSNGDYVFTYYMPKTHKYNTIPVSEIVGKVIEEAISESRRTCGGNCKYIFSSDENRPISVETFSLQMNNMSAKFGLTRDDGSPLRIKGHTFRGTLATQYVNCGIGMDVIRMMLGQEKIGVLKHYIRIHSDTMVSYMKPIMDEYDRKIRSIYDEDAIVDNVTEPALIPLPNGRCSKSIESGICKHANNCYGCRMFRPSIEFIDVYKKQLRDAENNIATAELHGYDRIKEMNINIRDNLNRIINQVEDKDGR